MADDVWVATNLTDDDTAYALIRAEDLRHLRLVGERPRLLARTPSGEVPLVDSPEPYTQNSGVVNGAARPPLPQHFHLGLVRELAAAHRHAPKGESLVIVRAVLEQDRWRWRTDSYETAAGDDNREPAPARYTAAS